MTPIPVLVAACPPVPGYTLRTNTDSDGSDIKAQQTRETFKAAAMAAACNATPNCKGFNNDGWLKFSLANAVTRSGFCLYTKRK